MKVSERIKEIREVVKTMDISTGDRIEMSEQLIQLEAEIVEVLRVARQEGFQSGRYVGDLHERG